MLINGSVSELELMRWGLFGVHWYWSLALGLRGNEHWLGARRELGGGSCGVLAGRIS